MPRLRFLVFLLRLGRGWRKAVLLVYKDWDFTPRPLVCLATNRSGNNGRCSLAGYIRNLFFA